jgi:3-hydroxypropanoate dehydrogenase
MTGMDAAGIDAEFFAGTDQHVLAVVNIGRPGPDAWFPRSPRLDFEDVVTTV